MRRRVTSIGFAALALAVTAVWPSGGLHAASVRGTQQAAAPAVPAVEAVDAAGLYEEKCALCHGLTRVGKPPAFPTLVGVSSKYTDAQITDQIRHGKGRMPAFPSLSEAEVAALVALLKTPPPADAPAPAQ